ncbi:hypothetical protein PCE1_000729 [Barthelona sp. PCE]
MDREETVRNAWKKPEGQKTGIFLHNTLTKEQNELILTEEGTLSMYVCGPTVYSSSHLGHARTYLGFDIIRRILDEYFNIEVRLVMNITDIDDKIIDRANEQDCHFTEISRRFEAEFLEDLKSLNIQMPDVLCRVSEYMPQVIDLIANLEDSGFAYKSLTQKEDEPNQCSVYFDTVSYDESEANDGNKHNYGKLEPKSVFDQSNAKRNEGEEKLGSVDNEKRNKFDFALWKASKPNEPYWDSPWGKGRPGWHSECVAMSMYFFGDTLTIHGGGMDLKFPHHDNEIAQAECVSGCPQWVDYFMHTGTLRIEQVQDDGTVVEEKMSKSLNNFWTVRDCLDAYTPRQVRMLFLSHPWNKPLTYGMSMMEPAIATDKQFNEFFHMAKTLDRESKSSDEQCWFEAELELREVLKTTRQKVDGFLRSNFQTGPAVRLLSNLVTATNKYRTANTPRNLLVQRIAAYVRKMLSVFGLSYESKQTDDSKLEALIDVVGKFREEVRHIARSDKIGSLLALCDRVRDEQFIDLGIRFEDTADGFMWKLEDPEVLKKERETAKLMQEQQKKKKEAAKLKRLQKELEELQIGAKDPLVALHSDEYGSYDEEGIPLTMADGEPVKKKKLKKLKKHMARHLRLHQRYLQYIAEHGQLPVVE